MTREEAINHIKIALAVPNRFGFALIDDGALETVVEALDRQKGGDLISKYEAISIPVEPKEERKKFKDFDDAFETGWYEALASVNMLPTADRKKGEWKQAYRKTANGVEFVVIGCSECEYTDPQFNYYNYCPNCGADMRGEEK